MNPIEITKTAIWVGLRSPIMIFHYVEDRVESLGHKFGQVLKKDGRKVQRNLLRIKREMEKRLH